VIVGIPVFENHDLTREAIASLGRTVRGPHFTAVIVDNGSPRPYRRGDYDVPFRLRVIRNEHNEGNFYPLRQVAELEPGHDIVALMHNDLILYEEGWDLRVEAAFRDDSALGMVGFAGSDAIGGDGERTTTLSNLRGTRGHTSAERAGTRITGLCPTVAVDGLFMAFRRAALPTLTLDPRMPPAHFYDRIWGAQVQEAGWRQATLGIECDHIGWSTEVRLAKVLDSEWRRWCEAEGLRAGTNPMDAIWNAGAGAWATYRPRFWPCRIDAEWKRT
jgi:GT2 family glycosyltransferase